MGWYGTYNSTLKSTLADLTKKEESERVDESGVKRKVARTTLAHCFRGNINFAGTLWSVVQIETYLDNVLNSTIVYIQCDLLRYDRRMPGWMNKPMEESCHPYYYNCPLKYLNMAPVANQEWRNKVMEYHNQAKLRRQAKKVLGKPFAVYA